jgi:NADPH2:quinone reductase
MRAVAIEEFGAAPLLMELPDPAPGPGEILVRLAAASPNPFDRAIHEGFLRNLPHVFPLVLGTDGAGVVEAAGAGVDRFEVGDAIYGVFAHEPLGKGTLAEYISVPEDAWLAKAPRRIPLARAAAAPTAGMTAIGAIRATEVDAGQTVLVVGATGGVGSFAVQLAAARGARVLATARADAAGMVSELGAAVTIDYTRGELANEVRLLEPDGVDALLDLVSDPGPFQDNTALVRDGGKAVSLKYAAQSELSADRITVTNFNLREHPDAPGLLRELTGAIDRGALEVVVDAEVPLERAPDFLAARALGGARGKAVIAVHGSLSPE